MRIKNVLFGIIVSLFSAAPALAQYSSPGVFYPPLLFRNEGSDLGRATRAVDCVGAGVTCTIANGVVTMTIAGGGSGTFTVTETEIDFDTCGIGTDVSFDTCVVTVTDAGVSTSSKVVAVQAGVAATGREVDDNEMDPLVCFVNPGTGDFSLTCRTADGSPTHGKFKIYYTVG